MPRRPRHGADRPRPGIRKSKARWGSGAHNPAPAASTVEDIDDVATLERAARQRRLHDPDHAVGGRPATSSPRSRPGSPRSGAEERRHLLRHAEPPGRGARTHPECDLVLVVGSPTAQFQPPAWLAEREGAGAHLIDGAGEIDPAWVEGRAPSASPPAPPPRTCWCRACWNGCAASARSACAELHGEPESMVFAPPGELRVRLVD